MSIYTPRHLYSRVDHLDVSSDIVGNDAYVRTIGSDCKGCHYV